MSNNINATDCEGWLSDDGKGIYGWWMAWTGLIYITHTHSYSVTWIVRRSVL